MNKKMPRRELFGPWLIRQINGNNYGVRWLDESRILFRLPWKHLNMKNANERDYGIFKAWAICSGKYNSQCEDPPTWKTNFRCALNQVSYHGSKMFTEIEDHSSDQRDPHKIYRFNGVHHDVPTPNPNVAPFSEAPSNSEAEQSFHSELNDEECTLRISPDILRVAPFPRQEESEVIEELMRNILLDSTENSIQQVLNLSQDEYTQDGPHVDQVYRQSTHEQWSNSQLMESCVTNGQEQAAHREQSIHIPVFREQYTQYQMCNIYQNGYPQNVAVTHIYEQSTLPQFQHPPPVLTGLVLSSNEHNWCQQENAQDLSYSIAINGGPDDGPRVNQGINSSPNYSYHTTNEECARSSPLGHDIPLVNGSEQAPAPNSQTALLNQQRRMPPLTSWEVTVYYRGKEVLKDNVSKNVLITSDVDNAQMDQTDTVQFPSTDMLVNHKQIKYTDQILSNVGKGLLLEVNPDNYKVYATRMGKSRVYWSLSESVETQETASEDKLLVRDVPTEIFDFNQFWEELKGYHQHRRPSPDYTIYMTFGQSLFEPVMRKFILVKLVPNLCTFLHQVAQQNGASSLHSEVVSLQISNGSSFNSYDLNGLCLMDLDFQALI
ncbi:interferon regulatory factor 7 isoform X2 [Hyla sarda]|uniref:interferon regulatory factor 7 isoform X2 n=1 Tax=Hyla sarda TaxID=327740 RepID=UPI0024C3F4ED|nr:interferon regulatory factor 7 isoform X2 [Hyla sarda]